MGCVMTLKRFGTAIWFYHPHWYTSSLPTQQKKKKKKNTIFFYFTVVSEIQTHPDFDTSSTSAFQAFQHVYKVMHTVLSLEHKLSRLAVRLRASCLKSELWGSGFQTGSDFGRPDTSLFS